MTRRLATNKRRSTGFGFEHQLELDLRTLSADEAIASGRQCEFVTGQKPKQFRANAHGKMWERP